MTWWVVRVKAGLPSGSDYTLSLTRQFDLRTRPDRALDDALPPATMEGLERR